MLRIKLDKKLVEENHQLARDIVSEVFDFIRDHSTVSVERTTLRIMGLEGANSEGIPYVNLLVDQVKDEGKLGDGAALYLGNAIAHLGSLDEVKRALDKGENLAKLPLRPEAKELALKLAEEGLRRIERRREERLELIEKYGDPPQPWIYVIVATGNIYEDVKQAIAAVRHGADVIAVIRSTAQSLLDYVPEGITTEGYGGTYATQANFRVMREALDEEMKRAGRYLRLVNYSSGLCMPEIAAMGALERLDMLLNDSMYGILFRDINPKRTFIDQYFSRLVITYADIIINTGEDNYLTTADAYEKGYTVITSHFINYHFAKLCGMPDKLIGLGHAFEINPYMKNSFLYELASAILIRSLFPDCPIKYMPPTRHVTGNIFQTHVIDAMFNLASVMTDQAIHLVGILTEAIHTPFLQDRVISLQAVKYIFNAARDLSKEVELLEDGIIQRRADELLKLSNQQLKRVHERGLWNAIAEGEFADIKRPPDGGKGFEGVFKKGENYFNPVEEGIINNLKLSSKR